MMNHSPNSKHGQPSILNLLQLHTVHLSLTLVLAHAHGVKSKIARGTIGILTSKHVFHGDLSFVGPPLFYAGGTNNLEHGTDADHRGGHIGVIDVHIGVHWEVDELTGHESGGGEHGHAAVLDFGFLEPFDVEVSGEVEGVEFGGADEADGGGGLDEEGHGFGHFGGEGRGGLGAVRERCRRRSGGQRRERDKAMVRIPSSAYPSTKITQCQAHLHIADGSKGSGTADKGNEGKLHHG